MLYDWSMESNHYSAVFSFATHFAKQKTFNSFLLLQNTNSGNKNEKVPKPARIPPQTPPAGWKSAEAGRIHSPRQIVSPCRVRFNHLDSARNSFELCPTNTAKLKLLGFPPGNFSL